jgi:hypothetical protein
MVNFYLCSLSLTLRACVAVACHFNNREADVHVLNLVSDNFTCSRQF